MKIKWDQAGEHFYETGVKNGVLYIPTAGVYSKGVAWNGLTAVTESPSGAEATALYADDIKYLSLYSTEEFGATIEAYTYPDEFAECDGSATLVEGVQIGQQARKPFGMCYKTTIGNDTDGNAHGYKLHIIYGAMASPSERAYATINDSPEAITFSWEVTTTPVSVTDAKPTASIVIDSTKVDATKLADLEKVLYGGVYTVLTTQPGDWTDNYKNYFEKSGETYKPVSADSVPAWAENKYYSESDPRLPLPDEIKTLMTPNDGE